MPTEFRQPCFYKCHVRRSFMGYSAPVSEKALNTLKVIEQLKKHPNYEQSVPFKGETKTQFILRAVSHLISPPQEEGESCEIECIDLAKAVKYMENELETAWLKTNPLPLPPPIDPKKLRLRITKHSEGKLLLEAIKGIDHFGFGTFLCDIKPDEIAIDEYSKKAILSGREKKGLAGFEIWEDNRIAWGTPHHSVIMPITEISKSSGADAWLSQILTTLGVS